MKRMKKFITAAVLIGVAFPVFAFAQTAQTAQLQSLYESTLKQVIALLEQEVAQLETQLASMNATQNATSMSSAVSSTTTTTSFVTASTSAPQIAATITLVVPSSTLSVAATATPTSMAAEPTSSSGSGISATLVSQAGKMPLQEIGAITIGASNSGPIELASLTLTFSGNGYAAGSSTFLDTVALKDPNFVDVATSFGATVARDANAGTVSLTFPPSAGNAPVVSSGERLTLQLWGTTNAIPGMSGISQALSAAIQNPGDLTFYDGADPTAIAAGPIPLSQSEVPITVASLSWGVGM